MSDTQVLLNQIIALRQRLENVQGLMSVDAGDCPASTERDRTRLLERKIASGSEHQALLDSSLKRLTSAPEPERMPTQLTARARRLLERGREQLHRLRSVGDEFGFAFASPDGDPDTAVGSSGESCAEPLAASYRESVSMTEATLRLIGAMPDAPSSQLRLCQGLDPLLETISERIEELTQAAQAHRQQTRRVALLADMLTGVERGELLEIAPFEALTSSILGEAEESSAIRFLHAGPEQPAQFVACHSLLVAQVMAQVIRHDPEWQRRPERPIIAALVHDVGMLRVPVDILTRAVDLTDEQRRVIEGHAHAGADIAGRLLPSEPWLAEATGDHHERLDGTGYPSGLKEAQIGSLTRLLAVCDVYAALCSPRPHRAAKDTRTALTDTLLLAERGTLDRYHAEHLLVLSFYPVGCAVEMADGAIGVVVATPLVRDLQAPARPVVAVLTDSEGRLLPTPQYLDLTRREGHSIVRSLPEAERQRRLGKRHPLLAA